MQEKLPHRLSIFLLLLVSYPVGLWATGVDNAVERALCSVCAIHEGETEMEKVRATADYQGQTFNFCSEKCRDTFVESPQGYLPPVLPRPAPEFSVRDLEGGEVASTELPKGAMLLDFWATWCPPCIKDLPRLTELHEKYGDAGFSVVSVSIDEGEDATDKIARAVKKRKAKHPIYLDSAEAPAWSAFQVRVVPTQYLLDAEGNIVAQWSGVIDLKIVEDAIRELLEDSEPKS